MDRYFILLTTIDLSFVFGFASTVTSSLSVSSMYFKAETGDLLMHLYAHPHPHPNPIIALSQSSGVRRRWRWPWKFINKQQFWITLRIRIVAILWFEMWGIAFEILQDEDGADCLHDTDYAEMENPAPGGSPRSSDAWQNTPDKNRPRSKQCLPLLQRASCRTDTADAQSLSFLLLNTRHRHYSVAVHLV